MAKAWITDRWLKKDAPGSARRSLNSAKNPARANVPERWRTSVYGKGLRWRVDWYAPNSSGTNTRHSKAFLKLDDAESYRDAVGGDLRSGKYVPDALRRKTFREAAEDYLSSKHELKASSINRYRRELRTYVLPRWGDVQLNAITETDINTWIEDLGKGEAPCEFRTTHKPKPLSPNSIHSIVEVTFGSVLRYAAAPKRRWLTIDPLSGIKLPRKQVTDEKVYLTYAEVEDLAEEADKIDPTMSGTLIRFLAYVGLRIGEATALKVSDMDFEKRRVSVLRTWTEDDKGKPVLGSPKTWERRRVAIPRFLVSPLKRLCSGQPSEAFVFRPKRGEHINIKNWYNRIWVKAVAGSGLEIPGLTIHSLRHTFASLSIAAGADVKTVQNALGHADASITLNVYASLWPDRLDEVAEIMEQQRDRQLN